MTEDRIFIFLKNNTPYSYLILLLFFVKFVFVCGESKNNNMGTLFVNYKYFQLQNYMTNKTVGSVAWNSTALLCHSSGCDVTLKMIKEKPKMFTVRNVTFIISHSIHFYQNTSCMCFD